MNKKNILLFCAIGIFFMCGCKAIRVPYGTPGDETFLNNGRLKSTSMDTYLFMTITAESNYYYDTTGKIREISGTVLGFPSGTTVYNYTPQGNVKSIIQPAGSSGENIYYTYDVNGCIATKVTVDSTGVTTDSMVFTNNISCQPTRIDETQNGTPSSYRLIIRDGSGYIIREDIYAPAGVTPMAYNNYTRDDIAKTISSKISFLGTDAGEIIFGYDSTGFYLSRTISISMGGFAGFSIAVDNTLQSGLFDAGGMTGYYYTDKDFFGVAIWNCAASGPGV